MLGYKSVLAEFFGDTPFIRTLDFLLENRLSDYSKAEIVRGGGVSKAALFKCWGKIEATGMVKQTRAFGNTRLYKLNEGNEFVKELKMMESALIKHYGEVEAKEQRAAVLEVRARRHR